METYPWENGNDARCTPERKLDLKSMRNIHHEMLRRSLLGSNNSEIAEELGVTPQTVCNTLNSTMVRQKTQELQELMYGETIDIAQRIQAFAPLALEYLEEIIAGKHQEVSHALRAKYASLHLGRAGYGEIKKNVNLNSTLKREEIEGIKTRAIAAAKASGMIDADYSEVRDGELPS